jgi:hypothetical protein
MRSKGVGGISRRKTKFGKRKTKFGKTKTGKIKVPLRNKIGRWPAELRSKVRGYRRPKKTGWIESGLSAGMPGNEDTDPGPTKR